MNNGFGGRSSSPYGNRNPFILVVSTIATLIFLGAAAYFYMASKTPVGDEGPAPVFDSEVADVLIPLQALEAGTALEPTMFRKESRPTAALGPSVVTSFEQIKGAYTASFVAAGQPLLSEYVTMKKPINQIQANIPEGYRGITVAVDTTTSVEGWARGGAKVDVVLSSSINGKPSLTVIVQNARVLSAGRQTSGDPGGQDQGAPSTVTLLVTAEEAARISLASSSGQLSLSLRGDEDEANYPQATTINIDSILGGEIAGTPSAVLSEGTIKIDGKEFEIVNGKLVPLESPQ